MYFVFFSVSSAYAGLELFEASQIGDDVRVRQLLQHAQRHYGINAHQYVNRKLKDRQKRTALHFAAQGNHLEVLRSLIEAKAEVNQVDSSGKTAIHLAHENRHFLVVGILIDANAEFDRSKLDNDTDRALDYFLQKYKYYNETKNFNPLCYLSFLYQYDISDIWDQIKKAYDDPFLLTCNAENFFGYFRTHGNELGKEVIEALDRPSGFAQNAIIHCAVLPLADESMLDALIALGANVNQKNVFGWTPLHIVSLCRFKQPEIQERFKKLIRAGASVHCVNNYGQTPLQFACKWASFSVSRLHTLVKAGTDVKHPDAFGRTALHLIASEDPDCWRSASILIQAKADVNHVDHYGQAPLHLAAHHGNYDLIRYLVHSKADISVKDKAKMTALNLAYFHGHDQTYDFLLKSKLLESVDSKVESLENNKKDFILSWFDITPAVPDGSAESPEWNASIEQLESDQELADFE